MAHGDRENRLALSAGLLLLTFTFVSTLCGMSLTVTPSVPAPAPLGTPVTWSANVNGADPGVLWYRFRSRRLGEDFHVIRDYSPINTLDWTASSLDGLYEVEAFVRNLQTGEVAGNVGLFQMESRVTGGQPVISSTANPTVVLYSAPECAAGNRMRVLFTSASGLVRYTPYKPCVPGSSMNFYLAGFSPNIDYTVKHQVDAGTDTFEGPALAFAAADLVVETPAQTIVTPSPGPSRDEVLLHGALSTNIYATDLDGNVIWHYPQYLTQFTRPQSGGTFFGIVENSGHDPSYQLFRKFDLAGFTVLETNAARVNEQLEAMHAARRISAFHHEARQLPDGKILVLASVEQYLFDAQGVTGQVDVVGDMILVLNQNLDVVWTWDAFEHLDVTRKAVLDEDCGACPTLYLASSTIPARDWLHGNAVALTPDGNLLYSSRHQDWLIKIAYNNGTGSGNVIWRLGKDGDFRMTTDDPWPWFSHQHDGAYEPGSTTRISVFDDGNTRKLAQPEANSRGQVLELDEQNRTATLRLNADLGAYAFALGSAQKLSNGNYHFCVGWLPEFGSLSVEVDPAGKIVYSVRNSGLEYRSVRMRDMYTPN